MRTVTTHEAPWTDEDRNLLLALNAEERGECDGCGHPRWESMDPATSGSWTVNSHVCRACEVLEATVSNDAEARKFGVRYAVTRGGGL